MNVEKIITIVVNLVQSVNIKMQSLTLPAKHAPMANTPLALVEVIATVVQQELYLILSFQVALIV